MRSHARASSAGSTRGQASRSDSFVHGVDATRGSSSDANGSGAPTRRGRLVAISLAAALLALALFASFAFASKQVISDFGTVVESSNFSGEIRGGFGGDLNNPRDVAVNEAGAGPANAGDVYVADENNNRIERFDANGNFVSAWGKDTIATVVNERQSIVLNEATGGTYTLSFDGSTTSAIPTSQSADIQGALAALPSVGAGNVEASGRGTAVNPFVVTFTGSLGGADQPTITADTSQLSGTVEISTIANGTSTTSDTGTGFEICTVATECKAGAASGANGALNQPQSVAVDQDTGNVYVSDRGDRRIDEFDAEGNFIRAFGWGVVDAGTVSFGSGILSSAVGIAAYGAGGNAYVSSGNVVHVFGPTPTRAQTSTFDGSDTDAGAFAELRRIAVDQSSGAIYAIDNRSTGAVIDKFDSTGAAQDFSALGSSSLSGADVTAPDGPLTLGLGTDSDIAVDNSATATDGRIYVLQESGTNANTAFVFAPDGAYLHKIALGGAADACGVAVDSGGNVWIADYNSSSIKEYDASGAPTGTTIDTSAQGRSCHFTISDSDSFYVARYNGALDQYDSAGAFQGTVDPSSTQAVAFDPSSGDILALRSESASEYPTPVAFPVYQVCEGSDVCKAGAAGSGAGQYGNGFTQGFGIAVSPADGNASTGTVYLADSGNRRVDTFDLDGTSPSSFGSSANFGSEQPRSVAVDGRGIVYASDSNNNGDVQRYDSQNADGGGVGFLAPIVPPADERQEIAFTGFSEGDSFKLTCPDGTPTEELIYSAGTIIIANGLEEACGAGNFSFSGGPPNVTVTLQGDFAGGDQAPMTCTALSGTGSCSVTTTVEGHPGPLLRGEAFSATAGLAVNPDGSALYVLRHPSSGLNVVQQFGPANEPGLTAPPTATDDTHGAAANFSSFTGVRGFGFDSASGRLYFSIGGDPDNFDGPLPSAHRVYVLDNSSSLPSPAASTPSVGAVTGISTRSATFNGEVDPKGGLVSCKFQYSTDEVSWTDVDVPNCVALNQNGGTQNIGKLASGLAPDTHYFARLQVTRPYFSGFTPVTSAVRGFTTASGPPVLAGVSAKAVDEHSVRITAKVDPSHSPTTYVIEYGSTSALGSSTVPVSVGGGTQPIEVSPVIGGLSPATQYHFKVVATNLVGSTPSGELTAATFPSPPSFGSCPNSRYRTGPSAKLPDCRAYEQVTPTDKFGADVSGDTYAVEASGAGDGVTFYTFTGFPGGDAFQDTNVFQSRFAGGEWSTAGLNTPPSYGDEAKVLDWTNDLRLSFAFALNSLQGFNGANLVMRDSADGSRTPLIPQGANFGPESFRLGGAFDGDSKVVFAASGEVPVTSGPAPVSLGSNVYLFDRETGELTLAGLLPDSACPGSQPCVPAEGSTLPAAFGNFYQGYIQDGHTVSSSGDVYFTDRETGQLYIRRDAVAPSASTVQVSASERTDCADHDPCNGAPDPDPAGTFAPSFMGATPDGSHAFFKSAQKLTDNSAAAAIAEDLYRFDPSAPAGQRLVDLATGAEAVGVLGYSDNGDYVYFAANADLDAGGEAAAGDCAGDSVGFGSFSGSCSIYLWRADGAGACATAGGCVSFVVRVGAGNFGIDGYDWAANDSEMKASRVSADGHILVFRSQRELTGYDNHGTAEFYRYDAESEQLTCLTCNPTGAPPVGAPDLKNPNMFHANASSQFFLVGLFLSRNLSADGNRFFFQSTDKLVSADVNGEVSCSEKEIAQLGAGPSCRDVYEWEAPGTPGGSCTTNSGAYSPANGGCIYLLSTGTGAYPSYLADVSESGDIAFIFSRQQLVPFDEDAQEDIYAVKVDGGLAYQNAARPAACEGDACRGASSKPSDTPGSGSAVFEGPGNPKQGTNKTRCPKGKRTVHSKGKVRCVAKHKKQKHKSTRHQERTASNNRRASR